MAFPTPTSTLSRSLHLPFQTCHLQLHPSSSKLTQSKFPQNQPIKLKSLQPKQRLSKTQLILKATENENNESETNLQQQQRSSEEQQQLGAEIKKAMKEKEKAAEKEEDGFISGVIDEIGKIEWPEFGKVIATTGVVLGVIVGSSVVLLTVNAVLAELSDRVFAGKGVQDFFG